jgi:hypothetical protein
VISARSAALAAPAYHQEQPDQPRSPGYVFLTGPSRRALSLPGIEVRLAAGPGPQLGDTPFSGLYLASTPRQLLENLAPTRERSGMARGLGRPAVEQFLVRQCDIAGEARLNEIRDQARALVGSLEAGGAFDILDNLIGALLQTRTATLSTPAVGYAEGTRGYPDTLHGRENKLLNRCQRRSLPYGRDSRQSALARSAMRRDEGIPGALRSRTES